MMCKFKHDNVMTEKYFGKSLIFVGKAIFSIGKVCNCITNS